MQRRTEHFEGRVRALWALSQALQDGRRLDADEAALFGRAIAAWLLAFRVRRPDLAAFMGVRGRARSHHNAQHVIREYLNAVGSVARATMTPETVQDVEQEVSNDDDCAD